MHSLNFFVVKSVQKNSQNIRIRLGLGTYSICHQKAQAPLAPSTIVCIDIRISMLVRLLLFLLQTFLHNLNALFSRWPFFHSSQSEVGCWHFLIVDSLLFITAFSGGTVLAEKSLIISRAELKKLTAAVDSAKTESPDCSSLNENNSAFFGQFWADFIFHFPWNREAKQDFNGPFRSHYKKNELCKTAPEERPAFAIKNEDMLNWYNSSGIRIESEEKKCVANSERRICWPLLS